MNQLNLPGGYSAWGGNAPIAILSGDGSVFWGLNVYLGGALSYVVFRQVGTGSATPVTLPGKLLGQGILALQPNGELWAVGFTAQGNGSSSVAYVVSGYQTFRTIA